MQEFQRGHTQVQRVLLADVSPSIPGHHHLLQDHSGRHELLREDRLQGHVPLGAHEHRRQVRVRLP